MVERQEGSQGLSALEAFKILLRPLLRFAFRKNILAHDALRALTETYVEIVEEQTRKKNGQPNISRICLATGLNRRDLAKLLRSEKPVRSPESSLKSRVIAYWENSKKFRDSEGNPKALTFDGPSSEFYRLAQLVTGDVHPATILSELLRVEALTQVDDRVVIKRFNPTTSSPRDSVELIARDISGLIHSGFENIERADAVPHLHIRTEYDNVYIAALPKLKVWVLEEGKKFHKKAREIFSAADKDLNPDDSRGKAGAKISLSAFSSWSLE